MTTHDSASSLREVGFVLGDREERRNVPREWPAFPWSTTRSAIETLAQFPIGTRFFPARSYEECILVTADRDASADPLNTKYFHAALWAPHLVDAAKRGWVKDVVPDGESTYHLPLGYFRLTDFARRSVSVWRLSEELAIWPLFGHVQPFLINGHHDIAVREAAVILEESLRIAVGGDTKLHGLRLVDHFFRQLGAEGIDAPNTRTQFRTFFAFVRNDFAHRPREVTLTDAFLLIVDCCHLFNWLRDRGLVDLDRPDDDAAILT